MQADQIRVVIADDQVSTRRALKALLAFEPRIVIVGEACNGNEAVRMVSETQPDLVLMDVQMPILGGLEATQKVKTNWPQVKVIVYTMFPGNQEEANQAGADYYMIKSDPGCNPSQTILSLFPINATKI